MQRQFFAVEIDLIFRYVIFAADVCARTAFHLFHSLLYLFCHTVGGREIVTVNLDIDGGLRSHAARAAARQYLERLYLDVFFEVLAHRLANFEQPALAVADAQQVDVHGNVVGTVGLYGAESVIGIGLSHREVQRFYFGIFFLKLFDHAQSHIAGNFGARTDGQLDIDADTGIILRGEKFRRNDFRQHHAAAEDEYRRNDDHGTMMHCPREQTGISAVESVEGFFDRGEKDFVQTPVFGVEPQQLRAEHGGKRKGGNGGYNHDDTYNPTQLPEQNTRHTGDERQGQEHRQHGKRGGDDRNGDFVRTVHGSLLGGTAPLDVVGYVFEHHDSVVHDHTDSDTQRTERYDVKRVSGDKQVTERSYQRNRNGNDDDNRRTPPSQEHQNDEHDDDESDEHRLHEAVDRIFDVGGGIDDDAEFDVGGQGRLYGGQPFHHLVGDVHRVGARLLLNDNHAAAPTVVVSLLLALFHGIGDAGDVAQVNGAAVIYAHDDVVELFRVGKFAFDAQVVGVGADVETAARRIEVFLCDDGGYGFDGQVVGFQLLRVAIDLNFTFGSTRNRHGTHARNTFERVRHFIVENFVKTGHTLLCRYRENEDRNIVGTEFEKDGVIGVVGQDGAYHVYLVAHVVGRHIDVGAVFEFERYDRKILFRFGGNVFEVAHGVERVLHNLGNVGFYIGGTCARVGGEHHNGIGLYVGEQVDGKARQRKQTDDDDSHETEGCGNRLLDGSCIQTHGFFFLRIKRVFSRVNRLRLLRSRW